MLRNRNVVRSELFLKHINRNVCALFKDLMNISGLPWCVNWV